MKSTIAFALTAATALAGESTCSVADTQGLCDTRSDCTWCTNSDMEASCLSTSAASVLAPTLFDCAPRGPRADMELGARSPMSTTGWKKLGRANPAALLKLHFAVKQQNTEALEAALLETSDPKSAKYGQHWSREAVAELTAPRPEAVASVRKLLAQHGVEATEESLNADMITAVVDVATAEKLLGATYYGFRHEATGKRALRTAAYTLPAGVAEHVDFVAPTVRLPAQRSLAVEATSPSLSSNTPDVLRALYNIPDDAKGTGDVTQAVASFLEQYVSTSDLDKFYDKYWEDASGTADEVVFVGDNEDSKPGIESMLDIETITTVGFGVHTEVWYTDGRAPDEPENEPFLDWLYTVGNTTDADVPKLFSVSYGEDEDSTALDYAERIVAETMEQGLRGISILFASGDSGVGSATDSCTTFAPQWPSASPYVTAVGGTHSSDPEEGAGLSSGGFSNRWAMPDWQADAVGAWADEYATAEDQPDPSLYNSTGSARAFPDVAAQAMNFNVVIDGVTMPGVAGTSAATPTFSAVIGLINDQRAAAGKSSMGFLNPWIYENANAFQDITAGNNPGCGTDGFIAVDGWDPVTGVGTPDYQKMLASALELP